jgi:hypothetical protein
MTTLSRRMILRSIGAGGAGLVLAKWLGCEHEPAQQPRTARNVRHSRVRAPIPSGIPGDP